MADPDLTPAEQAAGDSAANQVVGMIETYQAPSRSPSVPIADPPPRPTSPVTDPVQRPPMRMPAPVPAPAPQTNPGPQLPPLLLPALVWSALLILILSIPGDTRQPKAPPPPKKKEDCEDEQQASMPRSDKEAQEERSADPATDSEVNPLDKIPEADLVASAKRPSADGSHDSRGKQALKKKVDNPKKNKYYRDLPKTDDQADAIIHEVYEHKNPLILSKKNRSGQTYTDVINPDTGRGIRIIDGKFDTFVNKD